MEHQAPWIESDGVNYIPMPYAVGRYQLRCKGGASETGYWYSYFNGENFCGTTTEEDHAENKNMLSIATGDFRNGNVDAWRDYQGLMSKPAEVIREGRTENDEEQALFEAWVVRARPHGDVEQVHCAWLESDDYADMMDAREAAKSPIMASDEPGIAAMAAPKRQPDGPTIIHGVTVDPAAFEAFLESQRPKPVPNNTPRGIMTVWNESADHRLGQWNQTGNIAD